MISDGFNRLPLKHGFDRTSHEFRSFFCLSATQYWHNDLCFLKLEPSVMALTLSPVVLHRIELLVPAMRWLVYAASVALATWIVLQLMRPAPQVAPAIRSDASVNFKIDQAPEARLLGIETTGGLTPPSIQLLGVFASNTGSGAAVMSIEGKPAQSVSVGQDVANGWKLDRVEPDSAVISRRGQSHRVNLPAQQRGNQFMTRVQ